jgi:hypothetical protein
VYVSQERGDAPADAEARRLPRVLQTAGPRASIDTLGDRLMLPNEVERSTTSQIAREFGDDFAEAVVKIAPGQWSGPVTSGYGLHLVLVIDRVESRMPTLAEARPLVEREFTSDRRTRALNGMYTTLLERYRVVIEKPVDAGTAPARPNPAKGGQEPAR